MFTYLKKMTARHWLGDLSQGQAFWVMFVPVLIICKVIIVMLPVFNMISNPVISTRIWIFVFAMMAFVIMPWLFVGTLRSVFAHKKLFEGRGTSNWLIAFWFVILILTIRQVYSGVPYLQNMLQIAGMQDVHNLTIEADSENQRLNIGGQLEYGATSRIKKVLSQNPDIKTIRLNLKAGQLHEARFLADLIEVKGFNTEVTETCAASCMLAFVAGKERYITESASIQFHQFQDYDNGYRSKWILQAEQEADRLYYVRKGIPIKFSFEIYYKQVNDDYFEPTIERLTANYVITDLL